MARVPIGQNLFRSNGALLAPIMVALMGTMSVPARDLSPAAPRGRPTKSRASPVGARTRSSEPRQDPTPKTTASRAGRRTDALRW